MTARIVSEPLPQDVALETPRLRDALANSDVHGRRGIGGALIVPALDRARRLLEVTERIRVALRVRRIVAQERNQIAHGGEANPHDDRVFGWINEGIDRASIHVGG